jgi:hypothetical protein
MERFRSEANGCDNVTVCGRFEIFVNFLWEGLKFRENCGCELGWSNFAKFSGVGIIWGKNTGKNTPDTA